MAPDLSSDIATIQRMSAVPKILESVAQMTGLRFVCVARVTNDTWHVCAVLDQLNFGLQVGGSLDVTTTLCEEVRDTSAAVIIDSVRDSEKYRDHHTPRIYGFQSYFSIPLFRPNGAYFGTLCGLDPLAQNISNQATTTNLNLFAELISRQLENEATLAAAQHALLDERETAELREQFIAVLGHDLRTPLASILQGADLLTMQGASPAATSVIERVRRSAQRISTLVDDVVDFTRGRMGGGISLNMRHEKALHLAFAQVIHELQATHPEQQIVARLNPAMTLLCDVGRMAQMLSNLTKNALVHGTPGQPVHVEADIKNGIMELSVTNSGAAIPADVVPHLFKPFWRSNRGDQHQGLGLGLFIVAEIARSHGGTVDIVSSDTTTSFIYRVKGANFLERRALPR